MTKTNETPALQIVRKFAVAPEVVFAALTEPAAMRVWWTDETTFAIDLRVGGRWTITRTEGETVYQMTGEYLEIERPQRLAYTIAMPQFSPNSDTITITIMPDQTGSVVTFVHAGPDIASELAALPPGETSASEAGWQQGFDLMAAAWQASPPLLVEAQLQIPAPPARVWQVLTTPHYIRQWDDLPDGYGEEPLALGSTISWEGHATLTVTIFEPPHHLRMALYVATWEQPPSAYDIAYTYKLTEQDGGTQLTITVGDFAPLATGQAYYDASVEFASAAEQKIKELAVGAV